MPSDLAKQVTDIVSGDLNPSESGSLASFPPPSLDTLWIDASDPADAARRIRTEVPALVRAMGLEPEEHMLVMSPMRRGPLGTNALNEQLRTVLRKKDAKNAATLASGQASPAAFGSNEPQSGLLTSGPLTVGDRVMQRRNNYEFGVVNGDVGFVADVSPDGSILVVFTSPAPKSSNESSAPAGAMFGGLFGHDRRSIRYTASEART